MSSKQREPIVFFIDRALGSRIIAEALRGKQFEIQVHDDIFPPNTPDESWLEEVGKRGWVVLTKDTRIRYRETERVELQRAGVRAFVIVSGNMTGSDMADTFIKAMPKMERFIRRHKAPFIAGVYRDGSVRPLLIGD